MFCNVLLLMRAVLCEDMFRGEFGILPPVGHSAEVVPGGNRLEGGDPPPQAGGVLLPPVFVSR